MKQQHLLAFAAATTFAAACGPSGTPHVSVEDWCVAMETAIRDRNADCECPGTVLGDEAIEARCAALDASSFLVLYDTNRIAWNGAIASARVNAIGSCDDRADAEVRLDDPVLGQVAPGQPCRVFADTWGSPDDCGFGSRCLAPLGGGDAICVEVAPEGDPCSDTISCDLGLACIEGRCAPSDPHCEGDACTGLRARGEACDADAECIDAHCLANVCAAPACTAD